MRTSGLDSDTGRETAAGQSESTGTMYSGRDGRDRTCGI